MGHNSGTHPFQLLQSGPAVAYQWPLRAAGSGLASGYDYMSSRLFIKQKAGAEFQKWGIGLFCMPLAPELALG